MRIGYLLVLALCGGFYSAQAIDVKVRSSCDHYQLPQSCVIFKADEGPTRGFEGPYQNRDITRSSYGSYLRIVCALLTACLLVQWSPMSKIYESAGCILRQQGSGRECCLLRSLCGHRHCRNLHILPGLCKALWLSTVNTKCVVEVLNMHVQ